MPALWRRVLLLMAWLVPLGVLLQALLSTPTVLFLRGSIELHGALSYLVLACALGTAACVWIVQLRWGAFVLSLISFVLLVAQTILGYVSRAPQVADHQPLPADDGLVVIHVSLGMVLLMFTLGVAFKLTRDVRVKQLAGEWIDEARRYDRDEGVDEYDPY